MTQMLPLSKIPGHDSSGLKAGSSGARDGKKRKVGRYEVTQTLVFVATVNLLAKAKPLRSAFTDFRKQDSRKKLLTGMLCFFFFTSLAKEDDFKSYIS